MISNKVNRTYSQYLTSNEAFLQIGSFIKQLSNQNNDEYFQQTVQQIRLVLSQDYPPLSKILAIKLIKQLFLMSKESMIIQIQNKLLPEISAVALYKDNQKGATFFTETNFYLTADERQKQVFKSLGVEYILLCRDSLSAWALFIPFNNIGHPSKFAEKYIEVKNKGVMFPKQRYLYKQSDKQIFQKIYKVQFFNQDSSLSESLLNQSNCDFVVGRQLNQFQQLQQMLKSTLQPNQKQTDWRKVRTIIQRLNIFFHESSVKMLKQLKDLNMASQYSKRLLQSQSKCGQLLEDYEYLKSSKMKYETFYNIYGYKVMTPQKMLKLQKSSVYQYPQNIQQNPLSLPLSPEVNMNKIKANFVQSRVHQPIQLGKKIKRPQQLQSKQQIQQIQLKQQPIHYIQKRQDNQQKLFQAKLSGIQNFYKQKIEEQKQKADLRVSQIKKLINHNSGQTHEDWLRKVQQQSNPLREKIHQLYQDLKQVEIQKQKLKSTNKQLQLQLSDTQRQFIQKDKALKKVLQQTERFKQMTNNYQQKIEYLQKQVSKQPSVRYIQVNSKRNSQVSDVSNKKLQKKIQNLTQQKDMLKEQLNNERDKKYQNMSYQTKLLKDQIQRLKGRIKQKQQKQMQFKMKVDNIEVENLKLKQEIKMKSTISESLKKQNEWITKTLNQINTTNGIKKTDDMFNIARSTSPLQASNRLNIKDYLEMEIEGSTYYDVLPKEFKIKYKRSCLKKKQLLYKQNNIEIGVISELIDSNNLNQTLFLTNYGTKDLHSIKIKILNPTSNQIEADTNLIETLKQGEQFKVYVDAVLFHYPIGPVILKLQYSDDQNQNNVQLLLPINIIKLVRTFTRHNPHLDQYKRVQFKYDHKMIQNHTIFKQYFPQVQAFQQQQQTILRMTVVHDHSRTQWNMDIEIDNDYAEFRWSQVSTGFEQIQDYYCKTLRNILTK